MCNTCSLIHIPARRYSCSFAPLEGQSSRLAPEQLTYIEWIFIYSLVEALRIDRRHNSASVAVDYALLCFSV